MDSLKWRKRKSQWSFAVIGFVALIGAIPFLLITSYVLMRGFDALSWDFFTQLPKPTGETGGGIANAIWGSAQLVFGATLLAAPWGIICGVYLCEFEEGKTPWALRLSVDLLASTPSIVIGIFVYTILVNPIGHFSGWAGMAALAVIMLPVVARTSEELIRLVPKVVREAGWALGVPRWKVMYAIVLPQARKGLMTGVILAIARIAGETAPLLFTALGNQYYNESLSEPTASLPVQVYSFATSGFEDLQKQAWSGAFVLVMFVLVINLSTRLLFKKERRA
jgi:phosphate transport system permease protein